MENTEAKLTEQFEEFVSIRKEALLLGQEPTYLSALLIDKYGWAMLQTLRNLELSYPTLEKLINDAPALIDPQYREHTQQRYLTNINWADIVTSERINPNN